MRWRALAAAALLAPALAAPAAAAMSPADVRIAYVPIDDRPATEYFPQAVAAICGAHLELPPQASLGHFQTPGDTAALERWLESLDSNGVTALVVSTDMLAYGGLVASRTAATPFGDAIGRLRALAEFHARHPDLPIYAFGTVMRLAPTAVPSSMQYLEALTHYAQLAGAPDPTPDQRDALAISRANIPDGVFWDYIGSRARDLKIDEELLAMASRGDFVALALTQDDAGSASGLQVGDESRLHAIAASLRLEDRALLNPGTDEMGMVMVVRAIEDAVGYAPSVSLAYPSDDAAAAADRLEYLPIGQTIGNLAAFLKMPQRPASDFELDVVAPDQDPARESAIYARIAARLQADEPTAIADLSFLSDDDGAQRRAVELLGAAGLASRPLSYASWNTTANTAGTALSAAAAALVGRRFGTFDADAAATFLFERYVDDYGYRLIVRPELQSALEAEGADTTALGVRSAAAESRARSMLWPEALALFDRDFKPDGYAVRRIAIHLPWQRTFEARIDADIGR